MVGARIAGRAPSGPAGWISANAHALREAGAVVILAGVAGGLRAPPHAGAAVVVDEAIDVHGGAWRRREPIAPEHPGVVALSVDCVAADVATKRRLAAKHPRAAIVDLESASFAAEAERRGLRWIVVRGISDGADDALPDGVDSWTTADGRTRFGAVAAALARRPTMVPSLMRLGRQTAAAMRAVGDMLDAIVPMIGERHERREP